MQTIIKHIFFVALLIFAVGDVPGMAQRFNHGGFSHGTAPAAPARPVAPTQRTAAPVTRPDIRQQPGRQPEMRQQPARQPEVRQPAVGQPEMNRTEERPSINGGVHNFGSHDYNRTVNVHQNYNSHPEVNARDRGVNVYHTGAYKGVHPYTYHPYRPYYWGPHWHPVGFFLGALAADAIWFSWNNQRYYYDDGCFYLPSNGGYSVVEAPIGAVVSELPPGYETTMVGNDTFYYFGGVFYIDNGQGYQVVAAPPGAVISELPVGAVEQDINGETLMVYNNTYYLPISQDGQDAYEVVTP